MRVNIMIIVFNIVIAGIFFFYSACNAIMFSNMKIGGSKAKMAQIRSAQASSTFFRAAGATFRMFSILELSTIPSGTSLSAAKKEAKKSLALLKIALEEFKSIREMKQAINAINSDMAKQKTYDLIFSEAAVFVDSQFRERMKGIAMKEGALGLLNVSIQSIEVLVSPDSPMGLVYNMIMQETMPEAKMLWAASQQWERAFQTGRIASSFFKVR